MICDLCEKTCKDTTKNSKFKIQNSKFAKKACFLSKKVARACAYHIFFVPLHAKLDNYGIF